MLNRIILQGRLTRNPELRTTQAGVSVCSFTLAVDRDFKRDGEKETDFIDVVAWRTTADFVSKYFAKGRMALVDGRLQIREWVDKEKNKRRSAEVMAYNVYFGDSKPKDENSSYSDTSMPSYGGQPDFHDGFGMPPGFVPNFGGYDGGMPV